MAWVRRFILFHDKRHPKDMGAPEVVAFLSHLAAEHGVGASTQNQALETWLATPFEGGRHEPRIATLDR